MRAMESFTQDVGGYPFLYADIFMSREEFEKMFDLTGMLEVEPDQIFTNFCLIFCFLTAYEKVREKYHANGAFPHLYDKVKPEIDVFAVGKEYMDPL